MKIEVDVKYNIEDKVLVTKIPGHNLIEIPSFPGIVTGYIIDKTEKRTVVKYLVGPVPGINYREYRKPYAEHGDYVLDLFITNAHSHGRRFGINCLEPYKETGEN